MDEQSFELRHRDYGKISKQLIKFYAHCKAGESIVFLMPEGKIYSQAAHNADKQAYVLEVLTQLRNKAVQYELDNGSATWADVESVAAVPIDVIDQAIQKIKEEQK